MNLNQMKAAMYYHAYIDAARDNADYEFTEAEEARFWRAWQEVQEKMHKLARAHFDEEVYEKIYGR